LPGFQEYILGVQPLAPQYAQVQIKPLWFGPKLSRARGKVPTERGDIEVTWVREHGRFSLTLTLPPNIRASVYIPLPDRGCTFAGDVGSGTHTFTDDAI
jgi:alpha-L-rhamnosidase